MLEIYQQVYREEYQQDTTTQVKTLDTEKLKTPNQI